MELVKEKRDDSAVKQELSPEKLDQYQAWLKSADYYDLHFKHQRNWEQFEKYWNTMGSSSQKQSVLAARKLWVNMKNEGQMLVDFLKNKIKTDLEAGDMNESFKDLTVYVDLEGTSDSSFFVKLLDDRAVWSHPDGSMTHTLLKYLQNAKDQESADAVIRFIENTSSPNYGRKDYIEDDLSSPVRALTGIFGRSTAEIILEEVAEDNSVFKEWFERHKSDPYIWTVAYSGAVAEPFDPFREGLRLVDLEEEVKEESEFSPDKYKFRLKTEGWSKTLSKKSPQHEYLEKYPSMEFMPEEKYITMSGMEDVEYSYLGESIGSEYSFTKFYGNPYSVTESEPERPPRLDRVVIKGSVALAIQMGMELNQAKDIDIYFVETGISPHTSVKNYKTLDEAKEDLPPEVFERLQKFIQERRLEELSLNVTRSSEASLNDVSLFQGEPEIVLFSPTLEVEAKFLSPIPENEKDELKAEVKRLGLDYGHLERTSATLPEVSAVKDYQSGLLIKGHVPEVLKPSSDTLASAMRILDFGERFKIAVDSSALRYCEEKASENKLKILIPSENPGDFSSSWDYVLDLAAYNIFTKESLHDILQKQAPNLTALFAKIQSAGGIREYVRKEYGEGYLMSNYVYMNDISFKDSGLSVEEQVQVLDIWGKNPNLRHVFNDQSSDFFKKYLALDKNLIVNKNVEEIAEIITNPELELLTNSKEADLRLRGYRVLKDLAHNYRDRGLIFAERYRLIKQALREAITKETKPNLRRQLLNSFIGLADNGADLTIATDFAEFVKKESAAIKSKKGEQKQYLSEEGMLVLQGLFELNSEDANHALYELLLNPEIDSELKKDCLKTLFKKDAGIVSRSVSPDMVKDLELDAQLIPWQDWESLIQVEKIANSKVRSLIRDKAHSAFGEIRSKGDYVTKVKDELAPELAPEFFLPLYKFYKGDKNSLAAWEKLLTGIKSSVIRDSFLFNLSNISSYDKDLQNAITEHIITADQVTKERILLADRLLKKIHFLKSLNYAISNSSAFSSSGGETEKPKVVDIIKLIQGEKPVALLETKIDSIMVSGLYQITGREDLTSEKIQSIFKAWEDPEPIFIFLSQLAGNTSTFDEAEDQNYRTLKLAGEMLAHMDPPHFEEWKRWRYNIENPFVSEQLKNLTPEQIKSYAEDEFVELGEVIVGLLPTDKPDRVREAICHGLRHQEEPEKSLDQIPPALKLVKNLRDRLVSGSQLDLPAVIKSEQESVDKKVQLADKWLDLDEDLRVLGYLPKELNRWQEAEIEKRKSLIKLGYRGDESRDEVDKEIVRLQKSGADFSRINFMASLKPGYFSKPIQRFFARYNLKPTVSPEELETLRENVKSRHDELQKSEEFTDLTDSFFSENQGLTRIDLQSFKHDLRAAQILLQLQVLTPQLIAFNKIADDKKKQTLQKSIDFLKEYFGDNVEIMKSLQQVEEVILEISHPVGKDNLALVFTDNPLVSLTVGRFPIGATSCQDYMRGDNALGAYMADAGTKVCLLIDINKLPNETKSLVEKETDPAKKLELFDNNTFAFLNAAVARRLTKKVDDVPTGLPQLFLEPVYTPLDRAYTTRIMDAYAAANLKTKLGIDMVKGGGGGEVRVVESRNGRQYEDGESGGPGGGGVGIGSKTGTYTMPARPLTERDYLVM